MRRRNDLGLLALALILAALVAAAIYGAWAATWPTERPDKLRAVEAIR